MEIRMIRNDPARKMNLKKTAKLSTMNMSLKVVSIRSHSLRLAINAITIPIQAR